MTQPFQHYEEATALLADNPGEYEIEKSKALATLALVAEQRTANLIALWGMADDACMALDTASGTGESDWSSVASQIAERLGLA